ncbi:MAG: hypothetical protein RMJ17_01400 [Candidatus Aenigmarchaeota archaeon]|nr:hypothetical protein [Candidatus Aenigmarchaeota archaeon]MDW8149236.1 hypothetical protein [Candidatus Aenigmarchaeota archaeon]
MKGIFLLEKLSIVVIVVVLIITITFLTFFRYRMESFYLDLFEYISFNNIPELFLSLAIEYEWKEEYYRGQEKESYCSSNCQVFGEKEVCTCKAEVPYIYVASYDYRIKKDNIFSRLFKKYFANNLPLLVCARINFGEGEYISEYKECKTESIIERYIIFFPLFNGEVSSMIFAFTNVVLQPSDWKLTLVRMP